jgi:hypothetical protein
VPRPRSIAHAPTGRQPQRPDLQRPAARAAHAPGLLLGLVQHVAAQVELLADDRLDALLRGGGRGRGGEGRSAACCWPVASRCSSRQRQQDRGQVQVRGGRRRTISSLRSSANAGRQRQAGQQLTVSPAARRGRARAAQRRCRQGQHQQQPPAPRARGPPSRKSCCLLNTMTTPPMRMPCSLSEWGTSGRMIWSLRAGGGAGGAAGAARVVSCCMLAPQGRHSTHRDFQAALPALHTSPQRAHAEAGALPKDTQSQPAAHQTSTMSMSSTLVLVSFLPWAMVLRAGEGEGARGEGRGGASSGG